MQTVTPTIIIDTREQTPLPFAHFPTERATLPTGDYSVKGFESDFCIERKSVADLVRSATFERERFSRELQRMRAFDFRRLLVVGTLADIEARRYRSQANPKSVIASVTAFEIRYQLPVCYCPTPEAAAAQIERWALYFVRERLLSASETMRLYALTGPHTPPRIGSSNTAPSPPPEGEVAQKN